MSSAVEKGLPENTERDHLLEAREELHVTCCTDQQAQRHNQQQHHHCHPHHHGHNHRRQSRYQQDTASRVLPAYEKTNPIESVGSTVVGSSSHGVTSATLPSIVVSDVDENDEDPPPYSAIAPPDHVGWPFVFSTHIPYSVHATQPCITEPPLAPFQTPRPLPLPVPLTPQTAASAGTTLTSPVPSLQASSSLQPPPPPPTATTTYRVEPPSLDRPVPTLSLTPYRFFKLGSHRSLFAHRSSIFDNASTGKGIRERSRKYGAILVAAAVIVFLMALSLMVRFVMGKSFWRR